MVAGVGLVHADRGHLGAGVGPQPLPHLLLGEAVRRVRHEEHAVARGRQRRRGEVAGHGDDGPLELRRRLDPAHLPLGEGHQAALADELARPLRLGLVFGAHGLQGRRVVVHERLHRLPPAPGAEAGGDLGHLPVQLGPGLAALLVQLGGAIAEHLLLAQQRGVELLAHPPGAPGLEALQEPDQPVERVGGGLGGARQPRPQVRVADQCGQRLGQEAASRTGLVEAALDEQAGRRGRGPGWPGRRRARRAPRPAARRRRRPARPPA